MIINRQIAGTVIRNNWADSRNYNKQSLIA